MGRSIKEWIAYYRDNNRYPCWAREPGPYPKGSKMFWDEDKGYAALVKSPDNSMMIVVEMCGDAKHWLKFTKSMAIKHGCVKIGGFFGMNPESYIRLLGGRLINKTVDKLGLSHYVFKDRDDCKVTVSEGLRTNKSVYNAETIRMFSSVLYLNEKVEEKHV